MCTERPRGFTLIELLIFIMVVGIGLAGVISVFNVAVRGSADPVIRKNMLSLAESLLEEAALQPFTYCDPATDPHAATAASALRDPANIDGTKCKVALQGLAAAATARPAAADNVGDYANLTLDPVTAADGSSAYTGYSARIVVAPEAFGAPAIASGNCASADDCTAMNALRIAVTVYRGTPASHSDSLTVEGYRTRHAPFSTP